MVTDFHQRMHVNCADLMLPSLLSKYTVSTTIYNPHVTGKQLLWYLPTHAKSDFCGGMLTPAVSVSQGATADFRLCRGLPLVATLCPVPETSFSPVVLMLIALSLDAAAPATEEMHAH